MFDGDVIGIILREEMDIAAPVLVGLDSVWTVWSCGGASTIALLLRTMAVVAEPFPLLFVFLSVSIVDSEVNRDQ